MKTWSLGENDPICLTLSADARFVQTDYSNDQIWELGWWGTEVPAIWLQSSYGRRTQSIHIFPAFTYGGVTRQDPQTFVEPVTLRRIWPNLAVLAFTPFEELRVRAEYFIPDSLAVMGRFTLDNLTALPQVVNLRLSAYLQPGEQANPMGLAEFNGVSTLSGQAGNIYPVVMLSGDARKVPAAYPSLQVAATIAPGGSKTWVWVHTAAVEQERSFERGRELIQIPWESTLSRIEMVNANMLSIETGDPDWDAILWMTQKELLRGFVGPTVHNSRPGLVNRRGIDDGYARSKDGKDYTGPWGGISTAATVYLARQVLPIAPDLVKDLLRNILRTQNSAGELDWAPGLGGQRAGYQALPLLATLAWDYYLWTEDEGFLAEVFPGLFSFYESWFIKLHDRDEDGFPEWDHVIQSDLESRPIFNRFYPWAQGFNVAQAEAVDLAVYLYREGQALIAMAQLVDREAITALIQERVVELARRVEDTWSEKRSTFQHVDRDSHRSHTGLQLLKRRGKSKSKLDRDIEPPSKLLLRLKGDPEKGKKLKVTIVSEGARKRQRTETITYRKFQSFWDWSTCTTEKLNHHVKKISVEGIDEKMTMEIVIPDLEREDISLLLPLWAGWMDAARARSLVLDTVMNPDAYWRQSGLSVVPATDKAYAEDDREDLRSVRMSYNSLIGIGMVEHGFRTEAGQLFQKLMLLVGNVLKRDKQFFERYHADESRGLGMGGNLQGSIPLDLFLAILGVRFISPTKLWVSPGHPFPWPVKIEWQGVSVSCEQSRVQIQFPDGQRVIVEGEGGRFIEQLDAPADPPATPEK
jgi:hypothetical protein